MVLVVALVVDGPGWSVVWSIWIGPCSFSSTASVVSQSIRLVYCLVGPVASHHQQSCLIYNQAEICMKIIPGELLTKAVY